ncbi:hypothetical protein DCO58_11725 [Helicobacter saguini]|uniref:Uncharacterized protein n=1 Tax=Helicobacter saguini TaxID=1548018 RepID=A0A347VQ81_9HELI|nr:hypothetical protein [Helicobacter saguini]MWV61041.1 hypothetical protein [Helicobacter saguini]MWV68290.1 hypothetical protein [Helicobacter saguini]MWV70245.1 hypothetical protein [Helicobacter saguini]MWV72148.1 hypothetical protein [Helicobacter saguini]TLD95210.1 hypothetical protein LS64_002265 [Helicobacter saguini]
MDNINKMPTKAKEIALDFIEDLVSLYDAYEAQYQDEIRKYPSLAEFFEIAEEEFKIEESRKLVEKFEKGEIK